LLAEDLESALVAILGPGNYTSIIRGNNNSAGVGVVEAYNLPSQSFFPPMSVPAALLHMLE
jgi:hypothetical protein